MAKKRERIEEDSALPEEQKTAPKPAAGPTGKDGSEAAEAKSSSESRIKLLEEEASDLKDKLLRKQADFENFRKRMLRERDETARYANAALLSDVIGLIDDFERAIRSAEESKDFASFLAGISLIEKQLVEMLESRWGLKRFTSKGDGFDPNKHEAVLRVEGPADLKPTVVEEYQKGYFLNERVLRPAKVKVMVPAQASGPSSEDGGSPSGSGESQGPRDPGAGP
jgi:molecular chaperone GrpE